MNMDTASIIHHLNDTFQARRHIPIRIIHLDQFDTGILRVFIPEPLQYLRTQ